MPMQVTLVDEAGLNRSHRDGLSLLEQGSRQAQTAGELKAVRRNAVRGAEQASESVAIDARHLGQSRERHVRCWIVIEEFARAPQRRVTMGAPPIRVPIRARRDRLSGELQQPLHQRCLTFERRRRQLEISMHCHEALRESPIRPPRISEDAPAAHPSIRIQEQAFDTRQVEQYQPRFPVSTPMRPPRVRRRGIPEAQIANPKNMALPPSLSLHLAGQDHAEDALTDRIYGVRRGSAVHTQCPEGVVRTEHTQHLMRRHTLRILPSAR